VHHGGDRVPLTSQPAMVEGFSGHGDTRLGDRVPLCRRNDGRLRR
jgi:hypothetical protein